jgi:hypothetical protein
MVNEIITVQEIAKNALAYPTKSESLGVNLLNQELSINFRVNFLFIRLRSSICHEAGIPGTATLRL